MSIAIRRAAHLCASTILAGALVALPISFSPLSGFGEKLAKAAGNANGGGRSRRSGAGDPCGMRLTSTASVSRDDPCHHPPMRLVA